MEHVYTSCYLVPDDPSRDGSKGHFKKKKDLSFNFTKYLPRFRCKIIEMACSYFTVLERSSGTGLILSMQTINRFDFLLTFYQSI